MNVDPAELLGRVREAPADSDDARAAVLEAGQHDLAATLSLLSRTDAPDSVRLLVIETLVPAMTASELLLLARFAGGQRQGVAERLGDLLANRSEPEAALVLIRVVAPRAPNARARIEAAAAQILAASPATGALHANLGSGLEDLRPGELGAAVVASSPGALADARDQISGRAAHRLALAEELSLLDDEFRAGGTAEGERRMRTAVYAAVSVLGIPDEGDLATRANDWLFRLDDLDVLRALAPHLPDGAVQLYAERSLARQNRRGERADRVTFALDLLRDHASSKVQAATRDLVLECLDEESPDFRAGALRTLAVQASDLDAALRERVGATYSALAPSEQAAIAGDMRVLGGEATQLDDEALLRWAISAPDTEAEDRLATLLARWNSGTATTELAAQFIETAGALTARLEPERRTGALDDLVRAAAQWLRSKGARLADPLAALRSWEGFTSAAAARTPILVEELRAEQTRRTLIDVGRAGPNEIAQIASATVDDDVAERLLLPPLTSLASGEQAPQIVKAWSETSSTGIGQRRLIAAVVLALGQLKRNIEELSSNASSRELAALDARLRHVLDALAQAEADAAGNDVLIEQFGSLRRSIAGLLSDETVREPSERVQSWRLDAASRYPELIGAPDAGRQIVKLVGDPQDHAEELNAVLLELDQRAHNPRVLSETERADTAEDLRTLAAAAASADMLTVDGPLAAALARPELGQVLLAQWADAAADQADELLSEELRALADPALARTALPRVDALAGRQPSAAVVLHEANTLDEETLDAVWRGVSAALRERLKQHANLKRRALGRDAEAMERVAERMDPPMRAIESLLFSYFRFRSLLGQAGWLSLEDQLGSRVRRERVRPEIHEIQGDSTASTFVVRSLGLKAKGHVIARAVLEPEDAGAPESGDET